MCRSTKNREKIRRMTKDVTHTAQGRRSALLARDFEMPMKSEILLDDALPDGADGGKGSRVVLGTD